MNEKAKYPNDASNPFDIKAVLTSIEKKQPHSLAEFKHQGQTFRIQVNAFAAKRSYLEELEAANPELALTTQETAVEKTYTATLFVISEAGEKLGTITGDILYEGTTFVSFATKNLNYGKDDQIHVKGLMSESIIQLVLQEVFEVWYSSFRLTEGGKTLYKKISEDPRVVVEKVSIEGNESLSRWKITTN